MESCNSSMYEYDLDDNELNSFEFSIPPPDGSPPSLDSVLRELTDDDTESHCNQSSLTSNKSIKNNLEHSLLHHVVLHGITAQLFSANERIDAGLPTTLAASAAGIVCIGTAHGIVLTFDSAQALRWCSRKPDYGGVSALCLNTDATRLLAGYERGHIDMFDAQSGDLLRSMPDAHAPQTAVLHLRFADWPNLAFCSDSAGCVFSLTFGRRLGMRSWDSKCIFSGARGEVCTLEPLLNCDLELRALVPLAMATLSKIIVVLVRPRLRIVFTHLLNAGSTAFLPLLAWQPLGPVLAFGRGIDVHFYLMVPTSNAALPLRHKTMTKPLRAFHFLSARVLACLDCDERLHILDVRTFQLRASCDLSSVGLIYASAHFKALATGGCVSPALARAGEYACYGSLSACGRRLLVVGVHGLHSISVRTAGERLKYLRDAGKWCDVLKLATVSGSREFTLQLVGEYLTQQHFTHDGLASAIYCCVTLNDINLLCGEIWEKVADNEQYESWYFQILEEHISAGRVTNIAPQVAQALVAYHEKNDTLENLESLLPSLNVACLDLHQLLSACQTYGLYTITLWLNATALHDYARPLQELLPILEDGNARLGNALLVYVSCCLAGRAYPRGELPSDLGARARNEVLCYLLDKPYKLLKALLKHDPHACVSVFELAFVEPEFSGDVGQLRRQNVVKVLLELIDTAEQRDAVLGLICRGVIAGTLTKTDEFIQIIVDWLNESINCNQHRVHKEQIFIDLLTSNVLAHLSNQQIIEIAACAKCYRVKEILLERTQEYSQIVECYLCDEHRQKDVFNYMRRHYQSSHRDIRTQLINNFEQILAIDKDETLKIVVELFPDLIRQLCERLTYQTDVVTELLWAAINSGQTASFTFELASFAQDAGDYELAARLLESSGDLVGALSLLLNGDAAPQAAALCARAPEPARLLDTVSDPKLLSRLLRATLADCAYETLFYETTCKLLSLDLHNSLCIELKRSKRGKYVAKGTVGCLIHKSTECNQNEQHENTSITNQEPDLSIF